MKALDAEGCLPNLARAHAAQVNRERRGEIDASRRQRIRFGRSRWSLQEEKEGGHEQHVGSWRRPSSVPRGGRAAGMLIVVKCSKFTSQSRPVWVEWGE